MTYLSRSPRITLRRAILAGLLVSPMGCKPGAAGSESSSQSASTTDTESETSSGPEIYIEFANGCIVDPYKPIVPLDEITMVLGGQGLLMFPMHLRAGGFDYDTDSGPADPGVPKLDFEMRVDGFNNGPGGTFARIANYPILFSEIEGQAQSYEFRYLTVFVPDEVSGSGDNDPPTAVDGLTAQVTYTFEVDGQAPVEGAFNALIHVPQPFEPEASCGF